MSSDEELGFANAQGWRPETDSLYKALVEIDSENFNSIWCRILGDYFWFLCLIFFFYNSNCFVGQRIATKKAMYVKVENYNSKSRTPLTFLESHHLEQQQHSPT